MGMNKTQSVKQIHWGSSSLRREHLKPALNRLSQIPPPPTLVLIGIVINRHAWILFCVRGEREKEREREMLYLTTHSTHFIYGYMASDIWLRTIVIVRKETRCRHIGYSYRLTARVLLYAPSHRQDNTYHGLCYTSRGALVGTRNSAMAVENVREH